MRNRLQKSRPYSSTPNSANFDIHQDVVRVEPQSSSAPFAPNDFPKPTLTPASLGIMNARTMVNGAGLEHDTKPLPSVPSSSHLNPYKSQNGSPAIPRRMSTIRAVPSFDERNRASFDDEVSSDGSPSIQRHSNSAFSSSMDSNGSAISVTSQPQENGVKTSGVKLRQSTSGMFLDTPTHTLEVPSQTSSPGEAPRSSVDIPQRDSSLGVTGRPAVNTNVVMLPLIGRTASPSNENHHYAGQRNREGGQDNIGLSATEAQLANGWDSTVGKAGLGKTGRVINRLVSDNEALKRDLKIERLKAEESRQAARLLEDKMERLVSDYESRLLEANVTKTLLSRKERQVESLQAAVELEKKRTADAQDRERTWREELEKVRTDTKRQVEEATNHATLMEGRYNAISSHWRDQGEEVKRAMARMGKEIHVLLEERRKDDDKIMVLRELCDQQDGNIKDLRRQKEDIARKFDEYKDEQESALHDIKVKAADREAQQERTLQEAGDVLNKLKWALNVKGNIEWAQ